MIIGDGSEVVNGDRSEVEKQMGTGPNLYLAMLGTD